MLTRFHEHDFLNTKLDGLVGIEDVQAYEDFRHSVQHSGILQSLHVPEKNPKMRFACTGNDCPRPRTHKCRPEKRCASIRDYITILFVHSTRLFCMYNIYDVYITYMAVPKCEITRVGIILSF